MSLTALASLVFTMAYLTDMLITRTNQTNLSLHPIIPHVSMRNKINMLQHFSINYAVVDLTNTSISKPKLQLKVRCMVLMHEMCSNSMAIVQSYSQIHNARCRQFPTARKTKHAIHVQIVARHISTTPVYTSTENKSILQLTLAQSNVKKLDVHTTVITSIISANT